MLSDASDIFWLNAGGTLATKSEAGTSSYVAQHMVLFTILLRMLSAVYEGKEEGKVKKGDVLML